MTPPQILEYGDPGVCLSLDGRSGKVRVAEAQLIAQFLGVLQYIEKSELYVKKKKCWGSSTSNSPGNICMFIFRFDHPIVSVTSISQYHHAFRTFYTGANEGEKILIKMDRKTMMGLRQCPRY
jgi:hypothetical protein